LGPYITPSPPTYKGDQAKVEIDVYYFSGVACTIVCVLEPVPENDLAAVRGKDLARHENSRYWVDLPGFSFFQLQPIDLYYVGGFGVMGWVRTSGLPASGSYLR
jgi:Pyridoxamine 5'-phosphate oxidase